MSRTRFHSKPMIIGLSTAALLLTACSGDSEDEEDQAAGTSVSDVEEAEAQEEENRAEAGVATQLTSVPDLAWKEIPSATDTVIEAPTAQVRVTHVTVTESLPETLSADLAPGSAGSGPVLAAEGEEFVVAVIAVEDPQWHPRDSTDWPTPSADIRLDEHSVNGLFFSIEGSSRQQTTVVVSVPKGTDPESLVVELESDGKYQELSLIDGTRVSSDVDYIYARATDVEVSENGWEETFDNWASGSTTIGGQIIAGEVSPFLPRHGWASPGNVYLALEFDTRRTESVNRDESTAYLELADGSTVTPEFESSSSNYAFDGGVWFQIPADTTSATVVVEVTGLAGTDEVPFDDVEVEVTLSGSLLDGGDTTSDEDEDEE